MAYTISPQLEALTRKMQHEIIAIASQRGLLAGELYIVDELTAKWKTSAPEYMADAVPEIKDYPTVAIAWACYYGMGAAAMWDIAWDEAKGIKDLYVYMRSKRGFDAMDEYIMEELMLLNENSENTEIAENAKKLTSTIQDFAALALTMIRKEGLEAQSAQAFYMFAEVVKLFFSVGVSLELFRRGYKYHKMEIN
ncbi:MAG: hypothetical protein R3Y22_09280 [Bacteroidales bacterium]